MVDLAFFALAGLYTSVISVDSIGVAFAFCFSFASFFLEGQQTLLGVTLVRLPYLDQIPLNCFFGSMVEKYQQTC